jgi:hypothetical protein
VSKLTLSTSQIATALTNAAVKYKVPVTTLLGVFGQESSFGTDMRTSSAGAEGAFQFTAANKGTGVSYPMTNTPNAAQFTQQADATAAYLAALHKGHNNNWDAAIQAYSGGGYGLGAVQTQVAKSPTDLQHALVVSAVSQPSGVNVPGISPGPATPAGVASTVADAASSIPDAISNAVSTVVGDAKYAGVFVALIAFGVMLMFRAFTSSSGGRSSPTVIEAAAA